MQKKTIGLNGTWKQYIYKFMRHFLRFVCELRPKLIDKIGSRSLGNNNSRQCFDLKLVANRKLPQFLAEIWDIVWRKLLEENCLKKTVWRNLFEENCLKKTRLLSLLSSELQNFWSSELLIFRTSDFPNFWFLELLNIVWRKLGCWKRCVCSVLKSEASFFDRGSPLGMNFNIWEWTLTPEGELWTPRHTLGNL
jgi:hypothetical protein